MELDSPNPILSEPFSPEVVKKLQSLEKKRRLTENRMLLWLAAPVLWALPFILEGITGWSWLSVFGLAWIFLVLFGLGIYIHVVLPSNDEISNQYKKIVIPDLLRIAGAEGDFSLGHGLKVESFLKSGLYHEIYSHFERTDSIIGKFNGIKFGLYELAVQVGKTMGGQMSMGTGMMMPQTSLLTNHFYGWVLHVPINVLSGNVFIIPAKRKTKDESDDWIKATTEYFSKEKSVFLFTNKDVSFDSAYTVFSTDLSLAEKILTKSFREFLLLILNQSANAPGFSFVGNRAYMHVGISDSAFDRQIRSSIYPPDTDLLMQKIRFFCAMTVALHSAAQK